MSKSDEIKDELNLIYGKADWKRRSKSKLNNMYELREFEEPRSGVVIQAFTNVESQRTQLYNGSKIIFGITQSDNDLIIRVAEPFYQQAEESNEGIEEFLPLMNKNLPSYLRDTEDGESMCDAGLHSRDQLVADMIAGGFTFDLTLANDLNEEYGGPIYKSKSLGAAMAEDDDDIEEEADEEPMYLEYFKGKPVMFAVYDHPTDDGDNGKGMAVCFNPEGFWDKNGHMFDQHVSDILAHMGFTLPGYLPDEDCENNFPIWEPWMTTSNDPEPYPKAITKAQVIADLTSAGFKFDQHFDTFINS